MYESSPRERISALRGAVAACEQELTILTGQAAQELWADVRKHTPAPPEPLAANEMAWSGVSAAGEHAAGHHRDAQVALLTGIGRAKQELGDAAGAELAFRAAVARAHELGDQPEAMPRLIALTCLALTECGRGDGAAAWLDALAAQVDLLAGPARADGLVWEAWTFLRLGRLSAAGDAAALALTTAEATGADPLTAARARVVQAWSAILRGRPDETLPLLAGLEEQLAARDERASRADAAVIEALALAIVGEPERALAAMQRAETLADDSGDLRARDHVDAVSAWVLILQGQPSRARPLAQRAQRGLPPAPTLERVLPALVEAEACLAIAAALPDVGGAQAATHLAEGRRLVERIRRATQSMAGGAPGAAARGDGAARASAADVGLAAVDFDLRARRIAAELDALFGLHTSARALADLEELASHEESTSALEQARALTAVAQVRGRLGDPDASSWRARAAQRATEAGALALARRLELTAEQGASRAVAEVLATGARNKELELLLEVGRAISSMLELDPLLERIMDALIEFLNGERGFLMLYDEPQPRSGQSLRDAPLNVRVARNMAREDVLAADAELSQSVVAEARRTGEPVIVNDAGNDDRFANKASVLLLNLRSVLCLPLRTNAHDFGLVYVENRSLTEIFGARHVELVRPLTAQAALAIDNAFAYQRNQKLYEETLSVARARERILNHVSHELKTPIAIVSGALKMLAKRIGDDERLLRSVARAERNIQRLIDIQQHMLDIYEARHGEASDADRPTRLDLDALVRGVIDDASSAATDRELELISDLAADVPVLVAPEALRGAIAGFLRNAIENTPDEGRIEVRSELDVEGAVAIVIRDFGIGITAENLPHVFEGFFHTQATERYSSRRPFEFDAGGKGLDLLRIRAVAERNGWDLSLASERCRFIPSDADICPGRISACAHCTSTATCHTTGWTEVRLVVPSARPIASSTARGAGELDG